MSEDIHSTSQDTAPSHSPHLMPRRQQEKHEQQQKISRSKFKHENPENAAHVAGRPHSTDMTVVTWRSC
ncbi:MAG: hypothetical protein MJE68_02910 [Proteobacteria bacterium]|nr:hypothetical protein [Pseudomonadota bacterium]